MPTASATIKSITLADVKGLNGTMMSQQSSFAGDSCGPTQCIVAQATGGGGPSLQVHFGDGSVHAPVLQTGLMIAHGTPHSVIVSLNGSDIFSMQCDAHGALKATPMFGALGASTPSYKWELTENGKTVKAGVSKGDAGIIIDDGSHTMGAMAFAISDRGVITLMHGAQTITFMPDAKDIGAKTGGYLRFDDLGLRGAGVSEIAVVNASLRSGLQPPGIRTGLQPPGSH
jgi:hypothetical protein